MFNVEIVLGQIVEDHNCLITLALDHFKERVERLKNKLKKHIRQVQKQQKLQ